MIGNLAYIPYILMSHGKTSVKSSSHIWRNLQFTTLCFAVFFDDQISTSNANLKSQVNISILNILLFFFVRPTQIYNFDTCHRIQKSMKLNSFFSFHCTSPELEDYIVDSITSFTKIYNLNFFLFTHVFPISLNIIHIILYQQISSK